MIPTPKHIVNIKNIKAHAWTYAYNILRFLLFIYSDVRYVLQFICHYFATFIDCYSLVMVDIVTFAHSLVIVRTETAVS